MEKIFWKKYKKNLFAIDVFAVHKIFVIDRTAVYAFKSVLLYENRCFKKTIRSIFCDLFDGTIGFIEKPPADEFYVRVHVSKIDLIADRPYRKSTL